jgi:ribose transport system substrate-binding protein
VAEKLPIPSNEGQLPVGLLTTQSPGTPSNSYNEPADYVQQFEKLWKIG